MNKSIFNLFSVLISLNLVLVCIGQKQCNLRIMRVCNGNEKAVIDSYTAINYYWWKYTSPIKERCSRWNRDLTFVARHGTKHKVQESEQFARVYVNWLLHFWARGVRVSLFPRSWWMFCYKWLLFDTVGSVAGREQQSGQSGLWLYNWFAVCWICSIWLLNSWWLWYIAKKI